METHILNSEIIAQNVARKLIGNYWLGDFSSDESFIVRYVGRSDTCLHRRLKEQAAKHKWEAFVFRPTNQKSDPITEAFNIECREYHLLKPVDNLMHPDKPSGLHQTCPYCNMIEHSTKSVDRSVGGEA
jgi:hypothetical protein